MKNGGRGVGGIRVGSKEKDTRQGGVVRFTGKILYSR